MRTGKDVTKEEVERAIKEQREGEHLSEEKEEFTAIKNEQVSTTFEEQNENETDEH